MSKNYSSTYLYKKYPDYTRKLMEFILDGEEIDKKDKAFEDIRYDIKRRNISSSLLKILDSSKVVLIISEKPLSKAFKVFVANDIRMVSGKKDISKSDKSNTKVFIDCSNLIRKDNGVYKCNNIDVLISYLVSAMSSFIYVLDENRIVSNSKLTLEGTEAFSSLFTYIVDFVSKISTNPSTKAKCVYLSSLYYLSNILGKDISEGSSASNVALKVSGLSSREAELLKYDITDKSFENINSFVIDLASILKISITPDILVERWMYLYGTGTVFALELFQAFSSMLTDAYIGAYINNQKTIEKVAKQSMVEFTKTILQLEK